MSHDTPNPSDSRPESDTGPVYRDPSALDQKKASRSWMKEGLALVLLLVAVLILNRDRFFADAPPDPARDGDTVARLDPHMPADDLMDGSAASSHPTTGDPAADDSSLVEVEPRPGDPVGTPELESGLSEPQTVPPLVVPPEDGGPPETTRPDAKAVSSLSMSAQRILEKRCASCHGHKLVVEGFSVLRHESLIHTGKQYVVPGNLEESSVWSRVAVDGDMPPEDQDPLSEEEKRVLRQWIMAGAAGFQHVTARHPVSIKSLWEAIDADLRTLAPGEALTTRYISLAELYNNSFATRVGRHGTNVRESDIAIAKAAVSKLINSLSWSPRLTVPAQLGPSGTLLRIQLSDYSWVVQQHWGLIRKSYPYGMDFQSHPDADMRRLYADVTRRTASRLPLIRGDWMVGTLPRSPLYDQLLGLPATVHELETRLQVDANANFLSDRVQRAGFSESGVSQHNRIVERHLARWGSYWKSYDFGSSEARGNIFKFPLGPSFVGNSFREFAFSHDGGEMIFTLPNGLQGYYLTDAKGDRLSIGPITVVRDLKETSGSPEIVNALSCMACHRDGIIPFRDAVRDSKSVPFGKSRLKVETVYAKREAMDASIAEDQMRFRTSVKAVMQPFLSSNAERSGSSVEPVFFTVRAYHRDLELDDVAAELFIGDPLRLKTQIEASRALREIGLGPLVQGAAIKRSTWASVQKSLFQTTALELEIAEPLH
jgi:hypothetical protein